MRKLIGWLTLNPAKALGIADKSPAASSPRQDGRCRAVERQSAVSVYSRPEKVWIDGALMFDADDPKRRPVSDFELGQPGEGDVK